MKNLSEMVIQYLKQLLWKLQRRQRAAKRAKIHKGVVSHESFAGLHTTIRSLLDDLDNTFKQIKKMRPRKHEMQRVIKKFGPFIVGDASSEDDSFPMLKLEGLKAYGLPSFLISYWPRDTRVRLRKGKKITHELESFICAMKQHAISYVGRRPGCVYYEVAWVVMHDKQTKKDIGMTRPYECNFYVEVERKTGAVNAIKIPMTHQINIPVHRSRSNPKGGSMYKAKRGRHALIAVQSWERPDMINDEETHAPEQIKADLEERFCIAYNLTMRREYGVNIIVKKGGHCATFIVPQNRWKYFFRERLDVMTTAGRKRPIFHAVIAHERHLKTGKIVDVKTHYRGSRNFVWNGYEILIVMQGKHGASQASFGISAMCKEDTDERLVSVYGEYGDKLKRTFEGDSATA